MVEPDTGLRDRMAFFWHGLLTTNAWKVSTESLLAEQLDHLRTNALGNYRELLQGYVSGGALLEYLDASWSLASNPNENLARELMELFTVGRGHYDETMSAPQPEHWPDGSLRTAKLSSADKTRSLPRCSTSANRRNGTPRWW